MIEQDLRFILAVENWAAMADDGRGGMLIERNPKWAWVDSSRRPRERPETSEDGPNGMAVLLEYI